EEKLSGMLNSLRERYPGRLKPTRHRFPLYDAEMREVLSLDRVQQHFHLSDQTPLRAVRPHPWGRFRKVIATETGIAVALSGSASRSLGRSDSGARFALVRLDGSSLQPVSLDVLPHPVARIK